MGLEIRRTVEDDVPALTAIVGGNYSRTDAERFCDEATMLFAPYPFKPYFYTAVLDRGGVVGCAGYAPSWIAYGAYTLVWVNVAKAFQGRGYGFSLVDRCMSDLRAKASFVTLGTSVPEFYAKNWGFREIDRIADKQPGMGDVVMSVNI